MGGDKVLESFAASIMGIDLTDAIVVMGQRAVIYGGF